MMKITPVTPIKAGGKRREPHVAVDVDEATGKALIASGEAVAGAPKKGQSDEERAEAARQAAERRDAEEAAARQKAFDDAEAASRAAKDGGQPPQA